MNAEELAAEMKRREADPRFFPPRSSGHTNFFQGGIELDGRAGSVARYNSLKTDAEHLAVAKQRNEAWHEGCGWDYAGTPTPARPEPPPPEWFESWRCQTRDGLEHEVRWLKVVEVARDCPAPESWNPHAVLSARFASRKWRIRDSNGHWHGPLMDHDLDSFWNALRTSSGQSLVLHTEGSYEPGSHPNPEAISGCGRELGWCASCTKPHPLDPDPSNQEVVTRSRIEAPLKEVA
jgi:hypothetical protein